MSKEFIRKTEAGAKPFAPSGLQALLMESATHHSNALGYTEDFFVNEKKGWAVLTFRAEIERIPARWEPVTVETWPTRGRGLIANRSFRMTDASGGQIARALTQWVFFDLVRRRPVKMPDDLVSAFTSDIPDVLQAEKLVIERPPESAKISERRFAVPRSGTDSNMHVNNIEYVKWAEDGLPDDVYYGGTLKSVRVNYRKEAKARDNVIAETYTLSPKAYASFIGNADGAVHAEILMEYR